MWEEKYLLFCCYYYYYCSFDYIYIFIGNTRGYLHAHKEELVEREKLRVKIDNSEKKILEEARGDRNYVMSCILHSVNRSRHFYFPPLEFILPHLQLWYNSVWGKAMKQFLRVVVYFILFLNVFSKLIFKTLLNFIYF